MNPTRYTLSIEDGVARLRVHFANGKAAVIESVCIQTGKSLDGMRKLGRKNASRFGVTFEDRTHG